MKKSQVETVMSNYYFKLANLLRIDDYTRDEAETILTGNSNTNNQTITSTLNEVYKTKET